MRKSRGIFLVSVMFVAMLAAMFVGAALELAPGGLGRARQNGESLMAQKASRSGIEYALTRLRQDPRWCGASNRVVVDTPDFFVAENDGMVIGWLKDPSGSVGQFRIRFNHIDGSPGADGLPDPASPYEFSYPYVSVNNLMGNSETTSKESDGGPVSATDRVIVPAHSVYLAVEGRAGRGLSGLDATNFNPGQAFSSVTPCTIECIQRVTNLGPPIDQAVVMGGGNVSLRLRDPAGKVLIDATSSGALVRMRSKGDIAVEDGASPNVDAPNAVLLANNVSANLPGTGVTVEVEDPAAEFYKIPASDVRTADGAHTLLGGTYTVDQNGNVDYYDMPLATYLERMSDPTTAATTLPTVANFSFSSSVASLSSPAAGQYELTISGDLLVEASSTGLQDLAIIPKRGAKASRASGGGGGGIGTIPADTTLPPTATNFVMGGDANHYLSSTADNVFYATVAQTAGLTNTISWGGGGEVTGQIQWGGGALTNLQGSGSTYSNFDNVEGNFPYIYTAIATAVGSDPTLFDQFPGQLSMWGYTMGGGGGGAGGGAGSGGIATEVTDTLTTRNLTLNLVPPEPGGTLTLSSPGDLVIGATLNGTGATLVSGRDIKIIGTGLDLASEPGASRGLSMYANGNISVSTYTEDLTGASPADTYRDFSVTGTIYANQGFSATVGEEEVGYRSFNLRGALVAYGGDPATGNPGSAGTVDITAANSNLIFDPAYLMDLYENLPGGLKLEPLTWNVR